MALLPAFTTVLESLNKLVTWFDKAIQEGGKLYPILVNIGAALSIMADGFAWAVDKVIDFVNEITGNLSTGLGGLVYDAAIWGAEIVNAFAGGMLDAESGAAANATLDLLHFKKGYTGGIATAAEPLCCAPDKIIIDGAQDIFFREKYMKVIDSLVYNGIKNGKLELYSDFTKYNFFGEIIDKEKVIEILGGRDNLTTYNLTVNCRNSRSISGEISKLFNFKG